MSDVSTNEVQYATKSAVEVASESYVEYIKYTAKTRNYPGMIDGMKMAYRRLIYSARNTTNLLSCAKIVGNLLGIHPHGDESAYSVLVECTCKYGYFPLFDGHGNFGGLGGAPSAMRYPSAKIAKITKLMYLDLIDYAEYVEGEVDDDMEPAYLPALIPYCFLAGSNGFSVGMPAPNIPPYNSMDLVNYYIDKLEGRIPEYPKPDFGPVILNCTKDEYSDYLLREGHGSLWFEPFITQEDYNKFVITQPTPNAWITKANKKVQKYIDDGVLDFNDETDKSGYRFTYTIQNMNKLDPEELKKLLTKGLSGSTGYRFMFEYNSRVYGCGFDYVVKHQLKYLRECVVRKYQDYTKKSTYQREILEAIERLRNDPVVATLHKMTLEEFKKVITDYGYSYEIASKVVSKPMSYLTRAHDDEIQQVDQDLSDYQEYIENPDKYLLEKYYELKEMITPFYKSRSHTIFKDDLAISDKNRCQLSEDHQSIEFGLDKSVDWNATLYAITKKAYIKSVIVNKINVAPVSLVDINEDDEVISVVGDKSKYIIFIIWNHIYVVPREKVRSGYNQYAKLWNEDSAMNDGISFDNEDIVFIDDHDNEIRVHCEDCIKSRISKPQYVSKNKLKYYINEAGDKVEINS